MDLFDLMSEGREDKALDRLEAMLDALGAEDEDEQRRALARAEAFCTREWGGYAAGLEALARRSEGRRADPSQVAQLRREAAAPGTIITEINFGRRGWEVEHTLPVTVVAARDECLRWEHRWRELPQVVAATARYLQVEELWRRGLPCASVADLTARMEYWAGRCDGDATGYAILLADLAQVAASLSTRADGPNTKERVRRLKSEHPDWSLARIGKDLGISRQAVHKHLKRKIP